MKTELRTKLAEFDESVGAAFDFVSAVFANPEMDSKVNGATMKAEESVETRENGVVTRSTSWSISYVYPGEQTLPELERVMVPG